MTAAVLFGAAAVIVGFSKTSVGGLGSIAIAIFASLMPARESTAAILLLLITGDVVAVWHYRHDCDWGLLRRLIPAVLPGLALGAMFLAVIDDAVLRRTIGVLLLAMAVLQLVMRRGAGDRPATPVAAGDGAPEERPPASHRVALLTGLMSGFATMTANAAGGVMTLYLVAQGVEKRRFLGTSACFFFGVNLCKLPFSAGLRLFGPGTMQRTALLAPLVLAGAWAGLHTARRLSQARFDQSVLAATVLAAVALVVR
ncbi:sulfite exporter TauE/SafE family protein [Pedococcus sp. 5OH_020]|uniref:sulfite exporter TauE/SafE family protein n=1 Tax=Pedococcus sp. 5OH_020 TaxID=2989814 RepID=UPI0022E9BB1E|nr:sulfite exporter TauE/SafE family protein [Pedococcus sp. 5OH_020]